MHSLEYVLNDVGVQRDRRLEGAGVGAGEKRHARQWRDLSRRSADDASQAAGALASWSAITPRRAAATSTRASTSSPTGVRPSLLGVLFVAAGPDRRAWPRSNLDQRILADGEIEIARACAERGTLVVMPTHSSNMDSPAIGFGADARRAAADARTAPARICSRTHSSRSSCATSARIASIAGCASSSTRTCSRSTRRCCSSTATTRCSSRAARARRSNVVEKHLKLGLLGTTVDRVQRTSSREGQPNKRIYIVPATINYRLVLEAETLIDDYLAETGKNRYIITDDEFSRCRPHRLHAAHLRHARGDGDPLRRADGPVRQRRHRRRRVARSARDAPST